MTTAIRAETCGHQLGSIADYETKDCGWKLCIPRSQLDNSFSPNVPRSAGTAITAQRLKRPPLFRQSARWREIRRSPRRALGRDGRSTPLIECWEGWNQRARKDIKEREKERASCKVSWEISDFPSTAKYKHVVDDHDFLEQGAERKGEAIESSFPSLERGSEEFADPYRHWNEIGGPPRSTTSLTKRTSSATPRLVLSNFLFRYVANEWRGKKNFSRWPSKFFSARWKFFWYFDASRMAEVSADVIEDATPTPVGPLINSPGALSFFFLFVSFSLPPWARYKYIFRYRVSVARLCVYCARVRRIFIHIVCWAAAAAVLPKEKGGAEQISQAIFSCVALKEMETRRRERERPR